MRQRTRGLSRQLPVPPRESNVLHRCRPPGESAVRTPAPLPGLPLPTTKGIGRPGTGSVRRDDGSGSGGATEGGAEPAADGEGQGVVWVLGGVSVSDQGTDREIDVSGKEQGEVVDEAQAVGGEDGR